MRPDEESVEPGEDPEHFIGILGHAQRVCQPGRDPGLHPVNALIVRFHNSLPGLATLLSNVKSINLLHIIIGKVDLLNSTNISSLQNNGLWPDLLLLDLQLVGQADLLGEGGPEHPHYHRPQLLVLPPHSPSSPGSRAELSPG